MFEGSVSIIGKASGCKIPKQGSSLTWDLTCLTTWVCSLDQGAGFFFNLWNKGLIKILRFGKKSAT